MVERLDYSVSASDTRPDARILGTLEVEGQRLDLREVADATSIDGEVARFELGGARYAIVKSIPPSAQRSPAELLTAREVQIAALVASGLINKEVANALGISEWTVCTHLRRIYSKLQVSTRGAMVFRCAELVNKVRTR